MIDKDYIEQTFPTECNGRDKYGNDVLKNSVKVKVIVYRRAGNKDSISTIVENCPYNTGGHGQRCKASHPKIDKIKGLEILCPYVTNIPLE